MIDPEIESEIETATQVDSQMSVETLGDVSSIELGDDLIEKNLQVKSLNPDLKSNAAETLGELNLPDPEHTLSLPAALCDDKLLEEINTIPGKMGFKIGEVADMLGIKQYVLRYWESEFEILKPKKATNNQRYYTKKDVENAYLIRKLLHRDRFSIEGARAAMKELKSFVRSEVKKDRTISTMTHKIEEFQDHVDDLLIQIRKIKMLF